MNKKERFLGISIIIASLLLMIGMIIGASMNRYEFSEPGSNILLTRRDKFRGDVELLMNPDKGEDLQEMLEWVIAE